MTATSRSVFVSTIGWSFVALSGMGTMITILQNVMVYTFFNGPDFDQAMRTMPADTPWVFQLMLRNFRTFMGLMLLASLTMLVTSAGLLMR